MLQKEQEALMMREDNDEKKKIIVESDTATIKRKQTAAFFVSTFHFLLFTFSSSSRFFFNWQFNSRKLFNTPFSTLLPNTITCLTIIIVELQALFLVGIQSRKVLLKFFFTWIKRNHNFDTGQKLSQTMILGMIVQRLRTISKVFDAPSSVPARCCLQCLSQNIQTNFSERFQY